MHIFDKNMTYVHNVIDMLHTLWHQKREKEKGRNSFSHTQKIIGKCKEKF